MEVGSSVTSAIRDDGEKAALSFYRDELFTHALIDEIRYEGTRRGSYDDFESKDDIAKLEHIFDLLRDVSPTVDDAQVNKGWWYYNISLSFQWRSALQSLMCFLQHRRNRESREVMEMYSVSSSPSAQGGSHEIDVLRVLEARALLHMVNTYLHPGRNTEASSISLHSRTHHLLERPRTLSGDVALSTSLKTRITHAVFAEQYVWEMESIPFPSMGEFTMERCCVR